MSYEKELLHILSMSNIPEIKYTVVNVFPHDTKCFTEGLIYKDGYIYESCGLYGQSRIQKRELKSGKLVREIHINSNYFSEGVVYAYNKFQIHRYP